MGIQTRAKKKNYENGPSSRTSPLLVRGSGWPAGSGPSQLPLCALQVARPEAGRARKAVGQAKRLREGLRGRSGGPPANGAPEECEAQVPLPALALPRLFTASCARDWVQVRRMSSAPQGLLGAQRRRCIPAWGQLPISGGQQHSGALPCYRQSLRLEEMPRPCSWEKPLPCSRCTDGCHGKQCTVPLFNEELLNHSAPPEAFSLNASSRAREAYVASDYNHELGLTLLLNDVAYSLLSKKTCLFSSRWYFFRIVVDK